MDMLCLTGTKLESQTQDNVCDTELTSLGSVGTLHTPVLLLSKQV